MLSVRSKHVHMCVRRAAQKLLANHKKQRLVVGQKIPNVLERTAGKDSYGLLRAWSKPSRTHSLLLAKTNLPNPFYSQLRNLRSPRSKLLHDYSKKERRIDRNGCRPTWIQGKGVQCTVGKKISFSKLYGNF